MSQANTPSRKTKAYVAPLLAAVLLVGVGWAARLLPTPAQAEPYHGAVVEAQRDLPLNFGTWVGRPIDVPPAAVELLKPNVLLSRWYQDPARHYYASFLVAQCKDARDLAGHWPPNCYRATGFTLTEQTRRDWTVEGHTFAGIEYTFERTDSAGTIRQVVANFLLIPGVGAVPDMDAVRDAGSDHRRRHLGAAQVQVVTDAAYSQAQRDTIFRELVGAHLPVINAIAQPSKDALPTTDDDE